MNLFFDLDGTIADTDPDIRGAWRAAIEEEGLVCPRFEELFIAGPPFEEMAKILFPGRNDYEELASRLRLRFAAHYDHDGFPQTREYPGVREELRRLKTSGHRLFIVTNKRYPGTLAIARHFGWGEFFDGFYSGDMHRDDEIGILKKPALLKLVMREVGASAADSVMIGDTRLDFEAGKANGLKTFAVIWGYGTRAEAALADVIIEHLPFPF